jgi:hexosaminidase
METKCADMYNTILSNGYIDLMPGLESHYLNDPCLKDHSVPRESKVLGELPLSELVTPL